MLNVGDNLKEISVKLRDNMEDVDTSISQVSIGLCNDKYLILNDRYFTKIYQPEVPEFWKAHAYFRMGQVSISDYTNDEVMSRIMGALNIKLYTTKSLKLAQNQINRELNKHIRDKCGAYGFGKEIIIELKENSN